MPIVVALPGVYLGVRQLRNGLAQAGVVGLGTALGFLLLFAAVFVVCIAVQVTGIALDVRDLRNRGLGARSRE